MITLYYGVGGPLKGLRLGVVNQEITDYNYCLQESLNDTYYHDYECDLNKISCRLLNSINETVAEKVIEICSKILIRNAFCE